MTAQHTPGPWTVDQRGWIHSRENWKLARVFTRNAAMGFPDAPDEDTTTANARLIAAAPDLLAALEFAKQRLECLTRDEAGTIKIAIARADAALAQARGDQP